MRKQISFTTYANTSITADVPAEVCEQGAEAIALWMQENCDFPTLCHQCASDSFGGNQSQDGQNLDLGDEWEPVRDEDGTIPVGED